MEKINGVFGVAFRRTHILREKQQSEGGMNNDELYWVEAFPLQQGGNIRPHSFII